jgi:hypothetical protein
MAETNLERNLYAVISLLKEEENDSFLYWSMFSWYQLFP